MGLRCMGPGAGVTELLTVGLLFFKASVLPWVSQGRFQGRTAYLNV